MSFFDSCDPVQEKEWLQLARTEYRNDADYAYHMLKLGKVPYYDTSILGYK